MPGARRAVEDLVGRVLVGPGGAQPGAARATSKIGVHLQVLVRVDRLAGRGSTGSFAGSISVVGLPVIDRIASGRPGQALAGVERERVLVELLEVGRPRRRASTPAQSVVPGGSSAWL